MYKTKFLLLVFVGSLLFTSKIEAQFSDKLFALNVLAGSKIKNPERGTDSNSYGVGLNLIHESTNFATTVNTSIFSGSMETYKQFAWSIGPVLKRPNFRARSQIGMGMIFFRAKELENLDYWKPKIESFDAFCITLCLEMDYYVSESIGFNFHIGKTYNADIPVSHIMAGMIYRIDLEKPVEFVLN